MKEWRVLHGSCVRVPPISRATRWSQHLVPSLVVLALSGGCENDESCSDGDDCGDSQPAPWVQYDASTPGVTGESAQLDIEIDGGYQLRLSREAALSEDPDCDEECLGRSLNVLCMTGRLEDAELAAVEAVVQPDLAEAYDIDDLLSPHVEQPRDRSLHLQPVDDGAEAYAFAFNSEGALQPQTELLIDTLDGIALELYARAEYCTDWDRSLAENGEWVFPITE